VLQLFILVVPPLSQPSTTKLKVLFDPLLTTPPTYPVDSTLPYSAAHELADAVLAHHEVLKVEWDVIKPGEWSKGPMIKPEDIFAMSAEWQGIAFLLANACNETRPYPCFSPIFTMFIGTHIAFLCCHVIRHYSIVSFIVT
jgi:hypothetical protein